MNIMMHIKINNGTFEDYSEYVSSQSDAMSAFCRDTVLTKVDDHTAIATSELFDPEGMKAMLSSDVAKEYAEKLGLERTLYNLQQYQ